MSVDSVTQNDTFTIAAVVWESILEVWYCALASQILAEVDVFLNVFEVLHKRSSRLIKTLCWLIVLLNLFLFGCVFLFFIFSNLHLLVGILWCNWLIFCYKLIILLRFLFLCYLFLFLLLFFPWWARSWTLRPPLLINGGRRVSTRPFDLLSICVWLIWICNWSFSVWCFFMMILLKRYLINLANLIVVFLKICHHTLIGVCLRSYLCELRRQVLKRFAA